MKEMLIVYSIIVIIVLINLYEVAHALCTSRQKVYILLNS